MTDMQDVKSLRKQALEKVPPEQRELYGGYDDVASEMYINYSVKLAKILHKLESQDGIENVHYDFNPSPLKTLLNNIPRDSILYLNVFNELDQQVFDGQLTSLTKDNPSLVILSRDELDYLFYKGKVYRVGVYIDEFLVPWNSKYNYSPELKHIFEVIATSLRYIDNFTFISFFLEDTITHRIYFPQIYEGSELTIENDDDEENITYINIPKE